MAHERLGERPGYRVGRLRRMAGLALVGLLLITACNESVPVDPGTLPPGGSTGGSTGGSGSDSTSLGDVSLVGTWVNRSVPANDADVKSVTTTWEFRADGLCGRSIVAETISTGITSELRVGTCKAVSNEISVLFTEEASRFTMTYGFPSVAVLTLDGVSFDQVSAGT